MLVSAHDVADELRRRLGDIGTVKLHKLLYYVQGWHIARTGGPVFEESIKAWANGPVVADLWADEKHGRGRPARANLDPSSLATIEFVIERYGEFSGAELIRLTHGEDPWRELSESDDPAISADSEITTDALADWFTKDPHHVWYTSEVERLRRRVDVNSFGPIKRTRELDEAIARAVQGRPVRHSRPG